MASLPGLKQLLLTDPDWGSSPVACLCNYATYAAVNLPRLHALDSQVLPAPVKAIAEATYLKKKMYYNMRIHTLRRKAAMLAHQAKQGLQVCTLTHPPIISLCLSSGSSMFAAWPSSLTSATASFNIVGSAKGLAALYNLAATASSVNCWHAHVGFVLSSSSASPLHHS